MKTRNAVPYLLPLGLLCGCPGDVEEGAEHPNNVYYGALLRVPDSVDSQGNRHEFFSRRNRDTGARLEVIRRSDGKILRQEAMYIDFRNLDYGEGSGNCRSFSVERVEEGSALSYRVTNRDGDCRAQSFNRAPDMAFEEVSFAATRPSDDSIFSKKPREDRNRIRQ